MKIIPVSFTSRDLSDFESVLDLATPRLSRPWTLGTAGEVGDLHIVSAGGAEDLASFLSGPPSRNPVRVIAYMGEEGGAAGCWKIVRREGSPPRLSELINVLNGIAQHFDGMAMPGGTTGIVVGGEVGGTEELGAETEPLTPAIEYAAAAPPGEMKEDGAVSPPLEAEAGKEGEGRERPVKPTLLQKISRFFTG